MEFLEHRHVLDSTVVFNEIMYHPAGDETSSEWIELHNQMAVDMDISEWRLDRGVEYDFPEGTVIPGGQYIVIASDPESLKTETQLENIFGPFAGRLSNGGDLIRLLNNSNRVMNVVDFKDRGSWPIGPDGSGAALAKSAPFLASGPANNWTTSAEIGGTPGMENFPTADVQRVNLNLVDPDSSASILVPTGAALGTDWTLPSYIEGSNHETWTSGTASAGFVVEETAVDYKSSVLADSPVVYWRMAETDRTMVEKNFGLAGDAASGSISADAVLNRPSLLQEPNDRALGISNQSSNAALTTDGFEKFAAFAEVGGSGASLEFLIEVTSLPNSVASLVGDGAGAIDFGLMVYLTPEGKLKTFLRTTGPGIGITSIESTRQLTVLETFHVVSTWDQASGAMRLFIDGQAAETNVIDGALPTIGTARNTDNPIFVGRDRRNAGNLSATIDEVAFYNYALPAGRVAAHSSAGQGQSVRQFIDTDIRQEMFEVNSSAYMRIPFDLKANISIDQLALTAHYDDGFMAYLNGVEIARENVAAGDQDFDSQASSKREESDVFGPTTIDVSRFIDRLRVGENLLAVHAMNSAADDLSFLIQTQITASGFPSVAGELPPILFNEVSAANTDSFDVEIVNASDQPMELTHFVIVRDGTSRESFVFPQTTIPSNAFLTLSSSELGFGGRTGDRLFLFTPNSRRLVDAIDVTDRLRGRSRDRTWRFPSTATFGGQNEFEFETDIVINEIMYQAPPETYGSTSSVQQSRLIEFESEWNYNAPENGLDGRTPRWFDADFDDASWLRGTAPLGANAEFTDYQTVVLNDQPIAYWPLDEPEGRDFADLSGGEHHGRASSRLTVGNAGLIQGGAGHSVSPSSRNRMTVSSFEKFPPGSTGFTAEYWIRLNSEPTGFHNVVGDGESGGDFYMMNYLTPSGQIRPHFSTANAPVSIDSLQQLQSGRVYHVVTTWDSENGEAAIYIDGQLDRSETISTNPPSNSGNRMFLGNDNREPGGDFDLDEVAIYNRPLRAAEVNEHFLAGGGVAFGTEIPAGPTTQYFRTEFDMEPLPVNARLELRTQIDDGAVFYLNGNEIHRQNVPEGPIDHTTLATADVESPVVSSPIEVSTEWLNPGKNVLAVEVHQATLDNQDLTIAAELTVTNVLGEDRQFTESEEEWIELYNRGGTPVDLTGWQFDDAIQFEFPAGTRIEPDGYLVVARDVDAFAGKFPEVSDSMIGNYNARLNDANENILLLDANGNVADEVHYYDGGRWPQYADGGGSSLELRNPQADNTTAESWAASDASSRSMWRTYSYRGVAEIPRGANFPRTFQEFSFGLLGTGEFLIDDIHVIEDPEGAAVEFLQNSSFADNADSWRLVGNHRGQVVVDPDDPSNNGLHVIATGPEEHLQNHVETTLKNGDSFKRVDIGTEYEITFRAKWISGSPQLNTRLFFNILPQTTILEIPERSGTPAARNSQFQTNVGPTFDDFRHSPIAPAAGEEITVSVAAEDPDKVAKMLLWYAVNENSFRSVEMVPTQSSEFIGMIPAQNAAAIVQFYVEGTDGMGVTASFPQRGRDSRALFQVGDAPQSTTGLHNMHVIVTDSDEDRLGERTNLMSNYFVGATVTYNDQVFYDVGVRLKGSEHGRPDGNRRGFMVRFLPDNLFRGVHASVGIDRSGGWRFGRTFGQDEIIIHQFMNRAGNIPGMYNDLVHVDAPTVREGTAILQLARFNDVYLDSQYENGSQGTAYEYELIYAMQESRGRESEKAAQEGPSVVGINLGTDLGDNKELYRHYFLIENNRRRDDYGPMIRLAKTFSDSGETFDRMTQEVLDVDQWLRAFAGMSLSGANDNYNAGSQHNTIFYQRPSDDKMLLFPFDMDFAFHLSPTAALSSNRDLNRLLQNPNNEHAFFGHLDDIMTTAFNVEYMERWVDHFDDLLPQQNVSSILSWIRQRESFVRRRLPDNVEFDITTENRQVDNPIAMLEGTGWVDVREVRVRETGTQLNVSWTTPTHWQSSLSVASGEQTLTLEAIDFQGTVIGTDSVTITSTATNPVREFLRITEINYNPADPTDDELALAPGLDNDDFEFVEFQNTGDVPIRLLDVTFEAGAEFTFANEILQPGEYGVIVQDVDAFALRYGNNLKIFGQMKDGRLSNRGERLVLRDALGQEIVTFSYADNDPWPESADGVGATLELIDHATHVSELGKPYRWRGSSQSGGSPGRSGVPQSSVVVNEVLTNTSLANAQTDSIELLNVGDLPVDIGGWFLSDSSDNLFKFQIPAATRLQPGQYIVFDESHFNPNPNAPSEDHFALSGSNGDDVWLTSFDADTKVTTFIDEVHFRGARPGEALGRTPDGQGRLAPLQQTTLGEANGIPRVGPVIVSEIGRSPSDPSPEALAVFAGLTRTDLQFIELHNAGPGVDLTDWRLRGIVDYDFAVGDSIDADATKIIVSFDPGVDIAKASAFRTHYELQDATQISGGFRGELDPRYGQIELLRSEDPLPNAPNAIPRSHEEEIIYDDVASWPASQPGRTIQRTNAFSFGNDGDAWAMGHATPGIFARSDPDFNADGKTDEADIDLLCEQIRLGSHAPRFDLNNDGLVEISDQRRLIEDILATNYGDASLDGSFNSTDLVLVFQFSEYEDEDLLNSGWRQGDWNCDGEFTSRDLVTAFQAGAYEQFARSWDAKIGAAVDQVMESHHFDEPNTNPVIGSAQVGHVPSHRTVYTS